MNKKNYSERQLLNKEHGMRCEERRHSACSQWKGMFNEGKENNKLP